MVLQAQTFFEENNFKTKLFYMCRFFKSNIYIYIYIFIVDILVILWEIEGIRQSE